MLEEHRRHVEERQRRIQLRMDRLWNEIQWRKLQNQLEKEMRDLVWQVTLTSAYDTQELEFIGSWEELLEEIAKVVDPDQITSIVIRGGGRA